MNGHASNRGTEPSMSGKQNRVQSLVSPQGQYRNGSQRQYLNRNFSNKAAEQGKFQLSAGWEWGNGAPSRSEFCGITALGRCG